jgi:hypothetical protein
MMQYVYIMAVYTIFCFAAANAYAGGEMKKVCHEDAKTKKEVCKTIKVHKKLEGTKVPPK